MCARQRSAAWCQRAAVIAASNNATDIPCRSNMHFAVGIHRSTAQLGAQDLPDIERAAAYQSRGRALLRETVCVARNRWGSDRANLWAPKAEQ